MRGALAITLVAALALPAGGALAFGSKTHATMTRVAVRAALPGADAAVPCAGPTDLETFFPFVHGVLRAAAVDLGDAAFARRFPSPETFDAFEAKGFLDLTRSPAHPVQGFDVIACEPGRSAADWIAAAAVAPDDDGRNQERIAFGSDRNPRSGTAGPFPEDPAVLDLGGLEGLASQAHAHYSLGPDLSPYPWLLWTDPARFAVAGTVADGPLTFGPEMVREHFLLALLAAGWAAPGADALALEYLGNALHYLQDGSDPLHLVQVGAPCVVVRALRAYVARAVPSFWGLFGELRSPVAIATDVVSNLHLWTETLWDVEVGPPAAPPSPADDGDSEPADRLARALGLPDRAGDADRPLGAAVYGAACDTASAALTAYGTHLEDNHIDTSAWVADANAERGLVDLGRRSVTTATKASRELLQAFVDLRPWAATPVGRLAVARAMLQARMPLLAARDARQAGWIAEHPEGWVAESGTSSNPLAAVAQLLLLIAVTVAATRWVGRIRERNR